MCGRYAASRRPGDLVEDFEIEQDELGATEPGPSWNVAPTDVAPVVRERVTGDAGRPVRHLTPMVWGLVPSWAKDRRSGAKLINARADTMFDRPAFRRAAVLRRCLVPADGWYEWQVSNEGPHTRAKQPFFLRPAHDGGLAFAGLYELWRERVSSGTGPPEPDAAGEGAAEDRRRWLVSYSVITTEAEPGLAWLHDRMPAVLPRERWAQWLDPAERDPDRVRLLLGDLPRGRFSAVAVSRRVNSVRNNGPDLVQALPVQPSPDHGGPLDPRAAPLSG